MGTMSLGVDAWSLLQKIYILIQKICAQVPQDCLMDKCNSMVLLNPRPSCGTVNLQGQNET